MSSKIGQHNSGQVTDWTKRASIVKQFNSGATTLSQASNAAVLVFRHYFDNQPYGDGCGVAAANTVIKALNGYNHPNLYVELYNEPNQADIGPLCQMIKEAVPVLHGAGLRVAAFSWGTGQPELSTWQYIKDSWNWCGLDPNTDAIALHEYSNNYSIDSWNMGRFKQLINFDSRWNIVVTECGFDNGGTNANGWIANGNDIAKYYQLLKTYDSLIKQYPQVLGATVFQTGLSAWNNFEFDDPQQQFLGETIMTDQEGQQLLDQNAHIAEALYALEKLREGDTSQDWQTIAREHINALNPEKYVF